MLKHTLIASALALFAATPASAQETPRFNRDIRPILSDKCYPCHGPDANTRKAGLRLDTAEGAAHDDAVVPGDAEASEVFRRITTDDPDDRMPPPASELHLDPEDIATLRAWIAAGAEYEPHWSQLPLPSHVAVPESEASASWAASPLDHFIFARLEEEKLTPASPAPKAAWLRRASFDLTGLPPTLEALDAFLDDTAPDARARAVDRLLASPAYGERMAMDWLDVARFADTFGYQADVEMDMWPWRDWVIKAFNENLPYDEFITWQIAGDLLENPTQEQRLATGFNRLHRQTNEGGSINEEFRVANVADRAETFATAFLGLTASCARCHDHKFDAFTQRDYFSLFAFFASIDESGLYSHFTRTAPTPSMLLYRNEQEAQHRALKEAIAGAETAHAQAVEGGTDRFATWRAEIPENLPETAPILHWPLDTIKDATTDNLANEEKRAKVTLSPASVSGIGDGALEFMGDDGVQGPGADFERWQPFTLSLWLKFEVHASKAVVLHQSVAESDAASRGYELFLEEGHPVFGMNHFWPGNAIRIRATTPLPLGRWVHVAARYDGSSSAAGLALFVDGAHAESAVVRDHLFKTIRYGGPDSAPGLTLAQRFRDAGMKGAADDVRAFAEALPDIEILALARQSTVSAALAALGEDQNEAARALRLGYYLQHFDEETRAARSALLEARRAESEFVETVHNIMAMEEMPEPRQSYVLARGEYDKPTDPVQPDTPAALPPFPADQPRNRLGLARWLTEPNHPLTARVTVNRYWQLFFGRGLVETQEDFGSQGKAPSHPELLDFLARRFIDSGWDVKALCREIALSATYAQDSRADESQRTRDPFNILLARGPGHRLNAEQIRDAALAASGLMVERIGGPSVKPYQPDGLWEDASSTGYTRDSGEGLYRRSIYTFIKRTVPPPALLTFDAGTREVCTVRRERTGTPLQALVLLNDPQYVEAARVLAERVLAQRADAPPGAAIESMFRLLIGRVPSAAERAVLDRAFAEQEAWFGRAPEEAAQFARAGEAPRSEELDPVRVAALSAVAQAIMNFDEFQVKR